MSEKIDILVDSSIDVDVKSQSVSASSDNDVEIEILEPDYQVSINKREYVITGDNLYIPKSYDESPQWLKDIIATITDFTLNQKLTEIGALSNTLYGLIDELEVAKNTYTQSIISSADIDERINARIETLNSSIADSDATIVDLIATKATPTEASSLALNVLTASINDGEISSIVGNIQNAISTTNSTLSNNIDILHSEMTGEFEGTADAIGRLRTYVGVSNDGGTTGTGLLADVEILQKQNDGIIETTTGTYDVMVNPQDPNLAQLVVAAEPYATWKAADITGISNRLAHIGDVYVKYANTANGAKEYVASYKFIRTVVDETSPYATDSDGFTWALIVDQAAQDAYEQALNAYDLADNKRRVFTATPSGPYDEGDLWVRVTSGSNQIWKCHAAREQVGYYSTLDWSIASTDDSATVALQTGLADGTVTVKLTNAYVGTTPFLTYLTNEIDSKVGVYSGETAPVAGQPSGVATNDIYLWFTTASKVLANGTTQVYDITRTYKYSGSAWAEITTDSNITALADLADGKRTVFSGNTVPVGAVARDIWIPSATNGSYLQGEIYQYSGAVWAVATKYSADLEAVRSNLQSQVDGKVETYYQATVPTGMTSVNNGDYWYCTADVSTYKKGKVYKYVHATTSWVETADVSRYAFDTADGKASIFSSISVPTTGYKINDMLIVIGSFNNGTTTFSDGVVLSSNANRVSGFTASDWVKKINDTEDLDAYVEAMEGVITTLRNQVDSKIENWYASSTSDPKTAWTDVETRNKHNGDLWYQTDTKNSYYYSSSTHSWNMLEDSKAIQALSAAATAQATADGVVVSYYAIKQDTAPATANLWLNKTGTKILKKYDTSWINVSVKVGDTLTAYDPDIKDISIYVYNGSSWMTNTENGIVATSEWGVDLNAYLDNKAVGGTSSLISDITATSNNNLSKAVNSRFAYNSNLVIDGVTYPSGFGLSNSAGTGIGSEFWINADKFKFTNNGKTGSKAPFTIDATGTTPQITFNGNVSFSNISNTQGSGTNLLYNSAPKIGNETKGWSIGWRNHGLSSSLNAGSDPWRPTGGASVYVVVPGNPGIGTVFDINNSRFPVVAGARYEASAYISSHRCNSWVTLAWFDSNGNYISEIGGSTIRDAYSGPLGSWGRSTMFTTAPSNAATAQFYVRSSVTSDNPYCFVAYAYAGVASANQTIASNWSEGSSAGATTTGELTNDAGFTTLDAVSGNINTNNDVFAQKLGYANYVAMVNAASSGHTIINGGYINTSLIQANAINADMINSNSALINKLNVTGGIVSNNIVVPGINGNNPLFSASGDKVVINNLKVLGTVSMPGISKGGNFSVPNLAVGSSHTVIVDKPYECNSWSLTAIVSLSNITGNGNTTNFGCRLYINGVQVSASHGVSTWAINVSTTGTLGGLVASQIPISINTSGFGDASGAFSGSISYIAIVEN